MQCTDEEIAAFFGVSTKTVERRRKVQRFSDVMEQARAKGRVSVRRNLFRLASNGNVAASIFLAKNLLGYRDVVASELSGPDGRPISIDSRPDLSNRRRIGSATVPSTALGSLSIGEDMCSRLVTRQRVALRQSVG
jgi:hypothetical protein